ncbi:MAG: DUF1127 domain-containing protein [Pseudomonadota bacterium]
MAILTDAREARAPLSLFALLRSCAKTLDRYIKYRREYRHLERLTDHQLKDIGLTRADIRRIKAEPVLSSNRADD